MFSNRKSIHIFCSKTNNVQVYKEKVNILFLSPLPLKVTGVYVGYIYEVLPHFYSWSYHTRVLTHIYICKCTYTQAMWGTWGCGKNASILITWKSLYFSASESNSSFLIKYNILYYTISIDLPLFMCTSCNDEHLGCFQFFSAMVMPLCYSLGDRGRPWL